MVEPVTPKTKAESEAAILARIVETNMSATNEKIARRLVESARLLAGELATNNETIATTLAEHNKSLATELKESNQLIAATLVVSTRDIARQVFLDTQAANKTVQHTATVRFGIQKRWNWSLILINALMAVIALFFGISFIREAITALMAVH